MSRPSEKPLMNLTREVPFGEFRSVELPYADNEVKTRRYTWGNALQQICFHTSQSLGYLWLLLIACIDCALLDRGDQADYSTLVIVFLGLFIAMLRETLLELKRRSNDAKTNAVPCKVWDGQDFIEMSSAEVVCGDLLLVGNGQQVVADTVLFFTERNDGSCYVDNSITLGAMEMSQKHAVPDVQRFCASTNLDRTLSTLGKIKGLMRVTPPNPDYVHFSGQLRMIKSPAAAALTMVNFILKGSRVYGAKWAICCVVAAGMETKVMLNSLGNPHADSPLERSLRRYSVYAVSISLLLILASVVGSVVTNLQYSQWGVYALESFSRLYRLVPAMMYLVLDVVRTAQTFLSNRNSFLEGRVRLEPLASTFRFGQVDYVVAEKNCVLTCHRPRVHTLIYRERMFGHCDEYFQGHHSCQQVFRRTKTNLAVLPDQCYLFSEKRPSGETVDGSEMHLIKTTEDSKNSCGFRVLEAQLSPGDSDDLCKLFECMVLCNTITQLDPLKARNKREEALVECGEMFGFRILESMGERTMLEIAGKRTVFKTLAAHYDTKTSEEMSVIMDKTDSGCGMFYIKGPIDNLGPFLAISEDLREHIRSMAMELKRTGLVPIVLACKQLDEDLLDQLKDKLWKAHSAIINVNVKIDAIFHELKSDLKYMGVACVEDTIGTDCAEGILKLAQAGIGLWVVSSDPEFETMASCLSVGLLGYEGYVVPITKIKESFECAKLLNSLLTEFVYKKPLTMDDSFSIATPRTTRFAPRIEKFMNELVTGLPQHNDAYKHLLTTPFDPLTINFSVVIDGMSFDTALKEEQTQCLLAALLFLSKGVCFCAMQPHQKAKVVKFLKNSFSFKPMVLTLADGLSAIPMLDESDLRVGVERVTFDETPYLFHAEVTSLSALADFLSSTGRRCYKGARQVIVLLIYENALLVSLMIYYSGLTHFTAISPVDIQSLWAVTMVATKPCMLFIALWYEDITDYYAIEHPQAYRWRSDPLLVRSIMKTLLLALFHGMILFVIGIIALQSTISPSGQPESAQVLTAIFSVSAFIAITAEMAVRCEYLNLGFVGVAAAGCVLFGAEVVAFNYGDGELRGYMEAAYEFPTAVSRMLMAPIAVAVVSYSLEAYQRIFNQSFASYVINGDYVRERIEHFSDNLLSLWIPSKVWKNRDIGDIFERTRITRTFKAPLMEENYQTNSAPELVSHIRAGFFLMLLMAIVCMIVSELQDADSRDTYFRVVFAAVALFLFVFAILKVYRKYYVPTNLISLCFFIISVAVYQALSTNSSPEVVSAIPIFSFLCFSVSFVFVLWLNVVNIIVYLVIATFNSIVTANNIAEAVLHLVNSASYVVAITISSAIVGYFIDEMNREKFCLLTMKEIELEKGDSVLKYLLPEFVRSRVKDGVRFIAEIQPQVHILFCELCGFDAMIQEYEAVEVTSLLNKVYQKFDEICETCGVTKIETVGKVYMACTGIKESELDLSATIPKLSGAQRLLYCGFEMIAAIEQFRLADGKPIKIKIGIHSGKVIAGVVGFHKPQFSLVGDTVNTASRMCSTLDKENFIQMSAATYDLLKGSYGVLFEMKVREVKGKGTMEVYVAVKDAETKSYRANMEAPDASVEMSKLTRRGSQQIFRGMTVAPRDSIFEANPEVIRAFQDRKIATRWWNVKHLKIFSDNNYRDTLKIKRKTAIVGLITVLVCAVVNLFIEFSELGIDNEDWESIVLRGIACVLLCADAVLSYFKFTQERFSWISMCLLLGVQCLYFIELFHVRDPENASSAYTMVMLITLAFVHFTGMRSYQLLPTILGITVTLAVAYVDLEAVKRETVRMATTMGIMVVYMVYVCYRDVRLENYIELKQVVQAEIEKTDHLLENLLPQHVLDSMRLESTITDRLENTTLLVADIVGFTAYSTDKEPSEVIEMLSNMFTKFDKLCLKYKTYKVYTIGDCYIAMGFSGKKDMRDPKQECLNVVKMAFDLKKVIAQVNDDHFTQLDMRIGIHTGEIIGAVVGTNIVRYDIYGRDVLIAFKMEANSRPGMVNVSQSTREFLEDTAEDLFDYEDNKVVEISSIKTKVLCYFVKEKGEGMLNTIMEGSGE